MSSRNYEIDGIRGWAALSVVLFHFFQECFGVLYPVLHSPLFGFILAGHLMVLIFFILSGDVLSNSFFKTSEIKNTVRIALARYFRLTFLVSVSCLISYFFMHFNIDKNLQVAPILHRPDWLGKFLDFDASFVNVVKYMLYGVYFDRTSQTYNPFLWTMSIELFGSMLVFLNIFIFSVINKKMYIKVLLVEFLFFWVFDSYFCLFALGMILGCLRERGLFSRLHAKENNFWIFVFFVLIAFWIFPYYHKFYYHFGNVITFNHLTNRPFFFLYAGLLVFLLYSSSHLVKLFSGKLSLFLGKISFPLYVLQFNVLVSFTSASVLYMYNIGEINSPSIFVIPVISVFMTIFLAFLFEIIEKRYLKALNWMLINKVMKRY